MKIVEVTNLTPKETVRRLGIDLALEYFSNHGHEIEKNDIELRKDDLGKPYIASSDDSTLPHLSLSLSHAGEWVAGALIDKGEIGIDIETVRKFSPEVLKNFLTERERIWLDNLPQEDFDTFSTLIWSFKESYLKALGIGLRAHPNKVEVLSHKKGIFTLQSSLSTLTSELWYNIDTENNYVVTQVVINP